jgi:hypothetical protein
MDGVEDERLDNPAEAEKASHTILGTSTATRAHGMMKIKAGRQVG